jgi:transcriptional regulator with XRE-family HTH domain
MRATRVAAYGDRSQGHVARLMRVSQSDVSRWESGTRVPRVTDFIRFARACGVPPERILGGIAPTGAEQLALVDLDARAARTIRGLVGLLRERSAPRKSRRAS